MGFHDFLNVSNLEMAKVSPLKLQQLCGSPCCYKPAKSELSRSNSNKVIFELTNSHSRLWGGGGLTEPNWSIVLDEGGHHHPILTTPAAVVDVLAMNRRHLAVIYNEY
jgi:hypothetical protein